MHHAPPYATWKLTIQSQIPYAKGISWPITTLGIIGAILINLGLIAPFIDAYKRDWRIIGVSFRFLSIDFAGAVFSLLSLCFEDTLDKEAAGSYITVMVLETGICIIQCSWIVRNWGVLREARRKGKSFDEFVGGEEVVKVERREVLTRTGGPRDWSFAGIFAAMNRRHGEGLEGGDAEKGDGMGAEVKRGAKVVTVSSAASSDESLVCQQPRRPDPVLKPDDTLGRNSRSQEDANNEPESNNEKDARREKDFNNERESTTEKEFQRKQDPMSANDFQSINSEDSSRFGADRGDEENVKSLEEGKR